MTKYIPKQGDELFILQDQSNLLECYYWLKSRLDDKKELDRVFAKEVLKEEDGKLAKLFDELGKQPKFQIPTSLHETNTDFVDALKGVVPLLKGEKYAEAIKLIDIDLGETSDDILSQSQQ